MKISYSWLKEYLKVDLSPVEIGSILTSTGLEVEGIEKVETIKGGLEGVVIGEVLSVEKHADADKLKVTSVNIGGKEPLQIVCGAPNVAVNQKVLVATVGTTLYPLGSNEGLKIKKSKIRGIESNGMICAEDELGIGNSHEGILVLNDNVSIGTNAADYFNIQSDFIFEIGLTPNRSDAMSHIGVARDLKAYLNFHTFKNLVIQHPEIKNLNPKNDILNFKIQIQNKIACKRYSGAIIKNITVKESPSWLKNRLLAIGLRPINNIVDITNFVMHEMGNPLHAFDLDVVGSEINIRNANSGETLITLDNVERNLATTDLLICNADTPMCIAGVMGGINSGVKDSTKAIFLEAAIFDSTSIRKSVKLHVLNSDSSFRFERGVDVNNLITSRDRAINLILELTGGELIQTFDEYPEKIFTKQINFNFNDCRKLIGNDISNNQIKKIIAELEYSFDEISENEILVHVPTYRYDVYRQADLTEEVLRVFGFNSVALPSKVNTSISYSIKPDIEQIQSVISELLVSNGFYEILNNSLDSHQKISSERVLSHPPVGILNPLSSELNVLRNSMIYGGLSSIEHNQNRQNPDLKLFEFGKIYHLQNDKYIEEKKLSLFITGLRESENWTSSNSQSTFYTLKAIVNKLIERFGLIEKVTETAITNSYLEDGLSYQINQKSVVEFGWLKKKTIAQNGIKGSVFYAEFNLENLFALISKVKIEFHTLPKTQFVRRDFSLLIDETIKFESIKNIATKTGKKLLKSVGLFDVYEGKNLPEGKKSYAVSFIFQDNEKTLQDAQVDHMMTEIRKQLETELSAELR